MSSLFSMIGLLAAGAEGITALDGLVLGTAGVVTGGVLLERQYSATQNALHHSLHSELTPVPSAMPGSKRTRAGDLIAGQSYGTPPMRSSTMDVEQAAVAIDPAAPASLPHIERQIVNRAFGGRPGAKFKLSRTPHPIGNGLKMYPPHFHDAHLLATQGEQRRTSLVVKLGKQVYPDVIGPFLKNLVGNGKVVCQFAGRMISTTNLRHVHFEHFRHNLSAADTGTNEPYPTQLTGNSTTDGFILTPVAPNAFDLIKGTTGGIPAGDSSFRELYTRMDYWAPFNKPDYEDMSWNLCNLRLHPRLNNEQDPQDGFESSNLLFQAAAHRRRSSIYNNNNYVSPIQLNNPATVPPTVSGQATYKFNAVFNKGKVEYEFMNKGLGGAKVELIVFRHKKNITWTPDVVSWYIAGGIPPPSPTCKQMETIIGAGYVDKMSALMSTDALNGRQPVLTDISTNPNYPLFPKLRETRQGSLAFTEAARQTFALASGDRRNVVIELPGIVYDPTFSQHVPYSLNAPQNQVPIMDEWTYTIAIACSGGLSTNQYRARATTADPLPSTTLLGDQYAPCNVQYVCTYTEKIGAMQYKVDKTKNIYTRGFVLEPVDPIAGYTQKNVTMLAQDQAVRIPPIETAEYDPAVSVTVASRISQGQPGAQLDFTLEG